MYCTNHCFHCCGIREVCGIALGCDALLAEACKQCEATSRCVRLGVGMTDQLLMWNYIYILETSSLRSVAIAWQS